MRGPNFDVTLQALTSQPPTKQFEEIKEVDEDIYDTSNYNSVAKLEPLSETVSNKRDSVEVEGKKEHFRQDPKELAKERPQSQFYREAINEDNFKKSDGMDPHLKKVIYGAQNSHPMMHVKDGGKGTLKNVMNNISQTTKIIINNIGSDFQKKKDRSHPDDFVDDHQFVVPMPAPAYKRPENASAEKRNSVNFSTSRPVSKRSSEDVKGNEFFAKDYPRMTSGSTENYRSTRRTEAEPPKRLGSVFVTNDVRDSWREVQDDPAEEDILTGPRKKPSKRSFHLSEFLPFRRSKQLSSTMTSNVISGGSMRAKRDDKLDFRSYLFSNQSKKVEAEKKELRRSWIGQSGFKK